MDTNLTANVRTDNTGKGAARKLRAAGRLPAVLYGKNRDAVAIDLDPVALDAIFRKSRNRNTVLQVDVDGTVVPCLVREAQRHPLSREILHVDLYGLEEGQVVTVDVPVEPRGRPKGAALGGRLRVVRRTLRVRCPYTRIPETVPVDVTPMEIGDIVRVADIPAPEGTEIVYESNFNVLTVYGKKGGARKAAGAASEGAGA